MKVFHNSSSQNRKCIICGKITGTSKVYSQTGIEVSIPVCDEHYDSLNENVKWLLRKSIATLKEACRVEAINER